MINENQKPDINSVKLITEKFQQVDFSLNEVLNNTKHHIEEVSKATKAYINAETESILKEIDVNELNRGELSVRVSALKKAGYTDFFKIYKTQSTSTLAKIDGISLDTAYKIKQLVYEDAKKIRENTTPRLNLDNKTKEASELVRALYVYQKSQQHITFGQDLYKKYHQSIQSCLQEIKPLQNKVKWFFSSKNSKFSALQAYSRLQEIERENFLIDATFTIDFLTQIANTKKNKMWKDFAVNSAKYYAILEKLEGLNCNNITSKNGLSQSLVEKINNLKPDFSGLNCTLRSYQEFGTKYILNQGYALLGDEMGLGKTVQAIASMVAIRNFGENRFLVVCPASVLINWCREINHHSNLKAFKLHGENRNLALADWIKFGGVGVTTYETLDKLDFTNVFNISLLVADEAHYVKNPKANRTITLMNVCDKSERVLFMTGTALENKVDEMCYLISCLDKNIALEIENMKHLASAPMFREKISPVYLRRTREDVLQELPDLIESEEWCEMAEEEKQAYYTSTMSENFMAMRQVSWDVDISKSCKAKRLLEIYEQAKEEKRKVIIFSFFLNTIEKVKQLFKDKCVGVINGSVDPADRQKIIDKFSASEDGSVLVAQIQAGGTGVNIQSASCVVICEPQLKPSTENQAISRTYRMGQTRNVLVYKLLCEDSVDERIVEILNNKETIFDNFADISVIGKQSIEIDKQATKNIVESEKERLKNQKNQS